jgi:lipid-A-disaccharide synthase
VKKLGIPILYYIVPQVWAWKPQRAKKMAALVDRPFCVFDFEPPFFEKFGLKTEFVGHPLVDESSNGAQTALEAVRKIFEPHAGSYKHIAFLPGSRESEIRHHLQPMQQAFAKVQREHDKVRALFSLPGKSGTQRCLSIESAAGDPLDAASAASRCSALDVPHARLLPALADFSVVKSGTSTLEAALSGNPMCALYKGSTSSYLIARMLVNIPVFSLVNIVLGRYAVPELLQSEVNPRRIAEEIQRGLFDDAYVEKQRAALAEIPEKLGGPGASARAARAILEFIGNH